MKRLLIICILAMGIFVSGMAHAWTITENFSYNLTVQILDLDGNTIQTLTPARSVGVSGNGYIIYVLRGKAKGIYCFPQDAVRLVIREAQQ